MSRPLEIGEKVLIISDVDVPDELLPLEGRVVYFDREDDEVWVTNVSDNPTLDCLIPETKGADFVLNFSGEIWRQTDSGRERVIRYSEKDTLGMERLKGIARFLRKLDLEENKHATV